MSEEPKPKYAHDCDECCFLGTWSHADQDVDLYFCWKQGRALQTEPPYVRTLVARFSDEGADYQSDTKRDRDWRICVESAQVLPWFAEAWNRVRELLKVHVCAACAGTGEPSCADPVAEPQWAAIEAATGKCGWCGPTRLTHACGFCGAAVSCTMGTSCGSKEHFCSEAHRAACNEKPRFRAPEMCHNLVPSGESPGLCLRCGWVHPLHPPAMDSDQVEIRGTPPSENVKAMMKALESGRDVHRETAALLFGKDPKDVTAEERHAGGVANLHALYGATWPGVEEFRQSYQSDLASRASALLAKGVNLPHPLSERLVAANEIAAEFGCTLNVVHDEVTFVGGHAEDATKSFLELLRKHEFRSLAKWPTPFTAEAGPYGNWDRTISGRMSPAEPETQRWPPKKGVAQPPQRGELFPDVDYADLEIRILASSLAEKGYTIVKSDEVARLRDLVRHQRSALHDAELITDEEYAALAGDQGAVARLEGYDAIQQKLKEKQ